MPGSLVLWKRNGDPGRKIDLSKARAIIGSSITCDVRIPHPSDEPIALLNCEEGRPVTIKNLKDPIVEVNGMPIGALEKTLEHNDHIKILHQNFTWCSTPGVPEATAKLPLTTDRRASEPMRQVAVVTPRKRESQPVDHVRKKRKTLAGVFLKDEGNLRKKVLATRGKVAKMGTPCRAKRRSQSSSPKASGKVPKMQMEIKVTNSTLRLPGSPEAYMMLKELFSMSVSPKTPRSKQCTAKLQEKQLRASPTVSSTSSRSTVDKSPLESRKKTPQQSNTNKKKMAALLNVHNKKRPLYSSVLKRGLSSTIKSQGNDRGLRAQLKKKMKNVMTPLVKRLSFNTEKKSVFAKNDHSEPIRQSTMDSELYKFSEKQDPVDILTALALGRKDLVQQQIINQKSRRLRKHSVRVIYSEKKPRKSRKPENQDQKYVSFQGPSSSMPFKTILKHRDEEVRSPRKTPRSCKKVSFSPISRNYLQSTPINSQKAREKDSLQYLSPIDAHSTYDLSQYSTPYVSQDVFVSSIEKSSRSVRSLRLEFSPPGPGKDSNIGGSLLDSCEKIKTTPESTQMEPALKPQRTRSIKAGDEVPETPKSSGKKKRKVSLNKSLDNSFLEDQSLKRNKMPDMREHACSLAQAVKGKVEDITWEENISEVCSPGQKETGKSSRNSLLDKLPMNTKAQPKSPRRSRAGDGDVEESNGTLKLKKSPTKRSVPDDASLDFGHVSPRKLVVIGNGLTSESTSPASDKLLSEPTIVVTDSSPVTKSKPRKCRILQGLMIDANFHPTQPKRSVLDEGKSPVTEKSLKVPNKRHSTPAKRSAVNVVSQNYKTANKGKNCVEDQFPNKEGKSRYSRTLQGLIIDANFQPIPSRRSVNEESQNFQTRSPIKSPKVQSNTEPISPKKLVVNRDAVDSKNPSVDKSVKKPNEVEADSSPVTKIKPRKSRLLEELKIDANFQPTSPRRSVIVRKKTPMDKSPKVLKKLQTTSTESDFVNEAESRPKEESRSTDSLPNKEVKTRLSRTLQNLTINANFHPEPPRRSISEGRKETGGERSLPSLSGSEPKSPKLVLFSSEQSQINERNIQAGSSKKETSMTQSPNQRTARKSLLGSFFNTDVEDGTLKKGRKRTTDLNISGVSELPAAIELTPLSGSRKRKAGGWSPISSPPLKTPESPKKPKLGKLHHIHNDGPTPVSVFHILPPTAFSPDDNLTGIRRLFSEKKLNKEDVKKLFDDPPPSNEKINIKTPKTPGNIHFRRGIVKSRPETKRSRRQAQYLVKVNEQRVLRRKIRCEVPTELPSQKRRAKSLKQEAKESPVEETSELIVDELKGRPRRKGREDLQKSPREERKTRGRKPMRKNFSINQDSNNSAEEENAVAKERGLRKRGEDQWETGRLQKTAAKSSEFPMQENQVVSEKLIINEKPKGRGRRNTSESKEKFEMKAQKTTGQKAYKQNIDNSPEEEKVVEGTRKRGRPKREVHNKAVLDKRNIGQKTLASTSSEFPKKGNRVTSQEQVVNEYRKEIARRNKSESPEKLAIEVKRTRGQKATKENSSKSHKQSRQVSPEVKVVEEPKGRGRRKRDEDQQEYLQDVTKEQPSKSQKQSRQISPEVKVVEEPKGRGRRKRDETQLESLKEAKVTRGRKAKKDNSPKVHERDNKTYTKEGKVAEEPRKRGRPKRDHDMDDHMEEKKSKGLKSLMKQVTVSTDEISKKKSPTESELKNNSPARTRNRAKRLEGEGDSRGSQNQRAGVTRPRRNRNI